MGYQRSTYSIIDSWGWKLNVPAAVLFHQASILGPHPRLLMGCPFSCCIRTTVLD